MEGMTYSNREHRELVDKLRAICHSHNQWEQAQAEFRKRLSETIGLNPVPVLRGMIADTDWLRKD